MADFVYVTIYNEGRIPWLSNTIGPVFGMNVGTGVYQFLARDPRIRIKITTPAEARVEKAEWLKEHTKKEEPLEVKDSVNLEERVEVVEKAQTKEEPESLTQDNEIDAILAEEGEKETYDSVDAEIKDLLRQPKKYTKEELVGKTKKQLGKILIERGYKNSKKPFEKSSEFAPKYHDTVESLIEKILKTQ